MVFENDNTFLIFKRNKTFEKNFDLQKSFKNFVMSSHVTCTSTPRFVCFGSLFCTLLCACKYFGMQNPAILQMKMLAGNFAGPGGWPGKPVGCLVSDYKVSANHNTLLSQQCCLIGRRFLLLCYPKGKRTQYTHDQQQQHLRGRGIGDTRKCGSWGVGAGGSCLPEPLSPPHTVVSEPQHSCPSFSPSENVF